MTPIYFLSAAVWYVGCKLLRKVASSRVCFLPPPQDGTMAGDISVLQHHRLLGELLHKISSCKNRKL